MVAQGIIHKYDINKRFFYLWGEQPVQGPSHAAACVAVSHHAQRACPAHGINLASMQPSLLHRTGPQMVDQPMSDVHPLPAPSSIPTWAISRVTCPMVCLWLGHALFIQDT
jgi:hypothetical protein